MSIIYPKKSSKPSRRRGEIPSASPRHAPVRRSVGRKMDGIKMKAGKVPARPDGRNHFLQESAESAKKAEVLTFATFAHFCSKILCQKNKILTVCNTVTVPPPSLPIFLPSIFLPLSGHREVWGRMLDEGAQDALANAWAPWPLRRSPGKRCYYILGCTPLMEALSEEELRPKIAGARTPQSSESSL